VPSETAYVPAAGWKRLTRLYDPIVAITMRERRFRHDLGALASTSLPQGGTLADVGCGTGTFAIDLARRRSDAQVVGIDGDREILALARGKEGADGVDWREGLAGDLPLADQSADVLTMSLMLHHLLPADKQAALSEARRVLRPTGHLCIADFGRPHDPLMRATFTLIQIADGFDQTRDHAAGHLPRIVSDSGFQGVTIHSRIRTAFGSLEVLTAKL
jgi:ubiquinone/menaquinone biosynthesis C-methylase UbiE